MPNLYGHTTTSATSTAIDLPCRLQTFTLVNKSAGAITVNVSVIYGSTNIWITPLNKSLAAGEYYSDSIERLLIAGQQIYILVSGACDYFFTIKDEGISASA